MGPVGTSDPPRTPIGANGPARPGSVIQHLFGEDATRAIQGWVRAPDLDRETDEFLRQQAPLYAAHPILHARAVFDPFSHVLVLAEVQLYEQRYIVRGIHYGNGDPRVVNVSVYLEQLLTIQPEMAVQMIRNSFEQVIHQLLSEVTTSMMRGF